MGVVKVIVHLEGKHLFDQFYKELYINEIAINETKDSEKFLKKFLYEAFIDMYKRQKEMRNGNKS